ncbi:hypothetical protein [Shewanella oncorhynchi]|uniref:hypothetical protein n=1 Tax=Shewanella oncorhynchi TaxID=2726434 RepID=UPI003D79C361
MQKFIQTAMFYLLVSVLIMMAGIIVGYLWSSDIGLWIHDAYYGGGVSVSTIFTVIGTAFTVLTFGLALKAYNQWRKPFAVDRLIAIHDRLLESTCLIPNLSETLYKIKRLDGEIEYKRREAELTKEIIIQAMNIDSIIISAIPLASLLNNAGKSAYLRGKLQEIKLVNTLKIMVDRASLAESADEMIKYVNNDFVNSVLRMRAEVDGFILDEYK